MSIFAPYFDLEATLKAGGPYFVWAGTDILVRTEQWGWFVNVEPFYWGA